MITCFFIYLIFYLVEFDLRKTVLQDLSIKYHQDTIMTIQLKAQKGETLIDIEVMKIVLRVMKIVLNLKKKIIF